MGVPIESLQHKVCDVVVPSGMLAAGGDHYALEMTGDGMIHAGILDGDVVVFRETDQARVGDIVVALVDDSEAMIRRIRRFHRHGTIALEAANPAYETRLYGEDRVRIQGKLVGVLRRY